MNKFEIVRSANFGVVQCDFYKSEDEQILMTREQIGASLEYAEPMKAIAKIHERHKERLDKFSFVNVTNGRNTYFYTAKGVMEICRWSQQPKADQFMDWVWDVIESLRTGQAQLIPTGVQAIKLVNQQVGMLINEFGQINSRVCNLENTMTIDYAQQQTLQNIARKKAIEAIGGKDKPAYKNNSLRNKVFSAVWKDYKDYFEVNSYKNTSTKDFEKAKQYLNGWQVQGKLLRGIEDCNSQIVFQEVC